MNRTIFVSRHGRSAAADQSEFQGWYPYPLSESGRADAHESKRWWAAHDIAWVVSSPILRATETAAILFERIDELDASFVECATPSLEQAPNVLAGVRYPELFYPTAWHRPARPPSPLTETRAAVLSRACAGLRRVAAGAPPGPIAVVSHGEVLLALLAHSGSSMATIPNLAVLEVEVRGPGDTPEIAAVRLTDPLAGTTTEI